RRRHTRLVSDWSSDVCSSDLKDLGVEKAPTWPAPMQPAIQLASCRMGTRCFGMAGRCAQQDAVLIDAPAGESYYGAAFKGNGGRSEERRVGEEGRDRCGTDH